MAVQIYTGNLSFKMTDASLRELFEKFGEVSSAKIVNDRETGKSKGFGFVEMTDQAAAENAIQQIDNTDVMGRNIRVNIARPKA
jgi:RNA recognition motif-containing protein